MWLIKSGKYCLKRNKTFTYDHVDTHGLVRKLGFWSSGEKIKLKIHHWFMRDYRNWGDKNWEQTLKYCSNSIIRLYIFVYHRINLSRGKLDRWESNNKGKLKTKPYLMLDLWIFDQLLQNMFLTKSLISLKKKIVKL